jgi:hypothetical protein
MPKTLYERLEALIGPVVAHDGRFLVWVKVPHPNMSRASHDMRDILPKLKGATLQDLREALPIFDKPKRGKVAVPEEKEV